MEKLSADILPLYFGIVFKFGANNLFILVVLAVGFIFSPFKLLSLASLEKTS
eukprot:Gb_01788 [translate_table: standard]